MSASTTTHAGRTVELGRYRTDAGEQRVLVGRRIDGDVRVYDVPLDVRAGRTYRVEQGFESRAELAALVRDYLARAAELGCPPMSRRALAGLVDRAVH